MDRYSQSKDSAGNSLPSEARLFAQTILGRAIPRRVTPECRAYSRLAELERLAPLSARHGQELRDRRAAEADADRERQSLAWAASISTKAPEKLRMLERLEERELRAREAFEYFAVADVSVVEWNEADHPRAPEGTSTGGQWSTRLVVGEEVRGRVVGLLEVPTAFSPIHRTHHGGISIRRKRRVARGQGRKHFSPEDSCERRWKAYS